MLPMKQMPLLALCFALVFSACKTAYRPSTPQDDGRIDLIFLQMNDVYEISPLGDGTGGLARVAGLRRQLLQENPNTFTVLAGDFISPSVIGTLKHEGKRIKGKQMIETLNALGLDWVVFGNHEFDYDLEDLQERLDESSFVWMAANARLADAEGRRTSFYKNTSAGPAPCPDNLIVRVQDADGTAINLGVFGVLIGSGRKPWVAYDDFAEAAKAQFLQLKDKTDLCVALTHVDVADDMRMAADLQDIPLWMGGHDHNNMYHKVGRAVVAKADANARTVYVHRVQFNPKTRRASVASDLVRIDQSIPEDPATAAVVARWEAIKNGALTSAGFNPDALVINYQEQLDCRDAYVRYQTAEIGKIITKSMLFASRQQAVCAVLNSGSIRVDDVLSGKITELDIVRLLPFGGGISEVDMRGDLLLRLLDTGRSNKGTGGFLQYSGVRFDEADGKWLLGNEAISAEKYYMVMVPDFLLTGNEVNMDFMNAQDNPGIRQRYKPDPKQKEDARNDIRSALIAYWRNR